MKTIIADQGECLYEKEFLDGNESAYFYERLKNELDWQQDPIKIYGKEFLIPRLHCWYGDFSYTYSKITMKKLPMPKIVSDLKEKIEEATGLTFNGVLANLYRNGRDSNGWHRDNEIELVRPTHIASLSLGAERAFCLRKYGEKKMHSKILLTSGSLLVMKAPFQKFWEHQIPKTVRPVNERINLTFRLGK